VLKGTPHDHVADKDTVHVMRSIHCTSQKHLESYYRSHSLFIPVW